MWIIRISDNSSIPYEEFMRRALYDPQRGYYTRRIAGIGHRGDFTTAPMMSGALAGAVALWAADALLETGCHDLIEIGPGEGLLAAAVLRGLPWRTRWKTHLHLVETSGPLAQIQHKLLGRRATWHSSPTEALAACGGRAVIFSNELVDAFPVRAFENTADGWREIAVTFDATGIATEFLLPSIPLPPSSAFSQNHTPGQRVEVHDSYRRWQANWLPQWLAGRMLTIDYGSTAERLYHRRPRGTLRGYLLQQRMDGPSIYWNPGRQDLTADVNFSDLIDWSRPWSANHRLLTLAGFLRERGQAADASLTDETGAGGAFMVLEQSCGL